MPPRTDRAGFLAPTDAPSPVEEAEPATEDRRTGARRTSLRRESVALPARVGRS